MSQRRPSLIFRFAGLLTLALLGLAALTYAWIAPRPQRAAPDADSESAPVPDGDPRWAEVRAWVAANPGHTVAICLWPVDLPRGGRIDAGPDAAPVVWEDGRLVQAVPVDGKGALVRASDSAPRAWAAWAGGRCEILPPASVRVEGRVEEGGRALPDTPVEGCGTRVTTDDQGRFTVSLDRQALELAEPDDSGRPRCFLARADDAPTRTPIDLARGGIQPVIVQ